LPAVDEIPVLRQYTPADRQRAFQFIGEALPPDAGSRLLAQWNWRESGPFTHPLGPAVYLLLHNGELAGFGAGYRVKVAMGGTICDAEALGNWLVHPKMRGRNLWGRAQMGQPVMRTIPSQLLFGWSRLPARVPRRVGARGSSLIPLIRILDAGPVLAHFAANRLARPFIERIGSTMTAAVRTATVPFRRRSHPGDGRIVQMKAFDERVDALWERARRPTKATVIRESRYLNWRYCQRPDASYLLYGFEQANRLDGFLVARRTMYRGMPWGYLVDFLAPEDSPEVLPALIEEAVDALRRLGAAAVVTYTTDAAAIAALRKRRFFYAPKKYSMGFGVVFAENATQEIRNFKRAGSWYLTMGDGDLELSE